MVLPIAVRGPVPLDDLVRDAAATGHWQSFVQRPRTDGLEILLRLQREGAAPQTSRRAPAVSVSRCRQIRLQDLRQLSPMLTADLERRDASTPKSDDHRVLCGDHARIGE